MGTACSITEVTAAFLPLCWYGRGIPHVHRQSRAEVLCADPVLFALTLSLAGFGVACHLGVLTGLPCVGVAKNLLHVDGLAKDELHKEQVRPELQSLFSSPIHGGWSKSPGCGELPAACPILASPRRRSRGSHVPAGESLFPFPPWECRRHSRLSNGSREVRLLP